MTTTEEPNMYECRVCGNFFKDNTPHHTPEELSKFREETRKKIAARKKLLNLVNVSIEKKKTEVESKSLAMLEISIVLPILIERYMQAIEFLESLGGLKYIESNFKAGEEDGVDDGWCEYALNDLMAYDLAISNYESRFPNEFKEMFEKNVDKAKEPLW